ncbi:MAG: kelch repeat-containing protein [Chthoniobacterales bacterium]
MRALHTATLLGDGTVMVAGGVTTGGTVTSICEIYNPATGVFSFTGPLAVARKRHRAASLRDGTVLVMGGDILSNSQGGGDRETDTAEVFAPTSGT